MLRKIIALVVISGLFLQQTGFAQVIGTETIPAPALKTEVTSAVNDFRPLHLRYLSYDNIKETVRIILDKDDTKKAGLPELQEQSKDLLSYFLTGVSLPDSAFWVNLRPDTQDRIIDPLLEKTDVGRILLEADVQLKKDTARLTSPETKEGREYWSRLYRKAAEIYGSEKNDIPTLTRPWIVPGEIIVKESSNSVLVYKATLKVMLEQDYLKGSQASFNDERARQLNEYSSQLIRELIIPKLTREINTARRYAALRQVYSSLILSRWFKLRFTGKPGSYAQRIDSRDIEGLTSKQAWSKTDYFTQYRKSFSDGEYMIKEQVTSSSGQLIRSYFSGGIQLDGGTLKVENGFMSAVDNAQKYGQVFETPAVTPDNIQLTQIIADHVTAADNWTGKNAFRENKTKDGGKTTYIGDAVAKYTVEKSNIPLQVMYLRNGINMHSMELYLNPAYSTQELAKYVLYEVYNRLTVFGAEEVVVDVKQEVYDEFITLFNTPIEGRGYQSLGSFMNLVYGFQGEHSFRIRKAAGGEFDSLSSDKPEYAPADKNFEKASTSGNYIGLDIGGSDIKIVVLNNGKIVHSYKEKWQPSAFTSAADPIGYMHRLTDQAMEEAKRQNIDVTAIGVSFNLAVVDNRPTGPGPVVEKLSEPEMEIIKETAKLLQERYKLPVFVLNDGDAGALWSNIHQMRPHTLALSLGTGLAGGYVDGNRQLCDYLAELGNIVLSLEEGALPHSFSKIPGASQRYLSQRLTFSMAKDVGIVLDEYEKDADKLAHLQDLYDSGDPKVKEIFGTLARYLAEHIIYINTILPVENVCLFGRVMSRDSGKHVLDELTRVLAEKNVPITVMAPEEAVVEFAQAEAAAVYAGSNAAQTGVTAGRDGGQKDTPGGIDFTSLPITIQPMGSFSGLDLNLPHLSQAVLEKLNIDAEIARLNKLVSAGTLPSENRVKELLAAYFQKSKPGRTGDSLLLCLMNILKQEEKQPVETAPSFKAALMLLDGQ